MERRIGIMKINNITLATTNYNVKPLKRNSNNVPNVSFKANHCCLPKRQNQTTSSFWSKLFHKNRNVKKNYNGLTRKSRKEYHCDEVTYSYKNNKEGLLFKVFENCTLDKNKNIKTASKIIYCYDNDNGLKNQFIINPKFCQNETLTEAESIIAVYNHNAKLDKVKIFSGVIFEQPENTAVLCKVIKYNKDDEKIIYTKDYINPLFCDDCRVSECDNSDNTSMTSESLDQELLYPSENWNEDVGENESCITAVNKKQLEIWLKISSEMRQEILQETKPDPDSPDSFESFYSNSSFRKNIDKLYPDRSSSSEPKGLVSDNVSPRTSSSDASKSKSINSPKSFQESQPTSSVLERVKRFEAANISTANEQQIQQETLLRKNTPLAISPKLQSLSITFGPTINQTSENKKQEEKQNEVSQLPYRSSSSEPVIHEETPIKKANSVIEDDASSFVSNLRSSSSDIQTLEQKKSSPRGRSNESILDEDDIPSSNGSSARTSFSDDSKSESINPQINSQKAQPTSSVIERAKQFERRISTAEQQPENTEEKIQKPKSMTRSESPQKPNVILKPIREKIEKNKAQKDALEKLKKLKARCNDLKEPVENYEKELKILEEKYKRKSSDAQNTNIVKELRKQIEARTSTANEQQAHKETTKKTGNELENEIDDENFKPILTIPKGIKFTYVKRSSDNEIAKQQEIPKPLENTIQQKGSNIERLKKTFENCNSDKPKTTLVKSQAKLRETARKVLENSDSLLAQENRLPTMDELLNIFEKEAKKQPEPKSMTHSESPQKPNVILKPISEKIEKKSSLKTEETAQSKLEKIENCQTTYEKLKAKSEKLGQTLEELKKQSQQKSLKEQENQGRLSNGTSKKLSPEMERLKNFFDSCSKPKAIQIQYKDLTNNE